MLELVWQWSVVMARVSGWVEVWKGLLLFPNETTPPDGGTIAAVDEGMFY